MTQPFTPENWQRAEAETQEQRLLAHLAAAGRIDGEGIDRAQKAFDRGGGSLPTILLQLGLVPEKDLVATLVEAFGLKRMALDDVPAEPVLNGEVSERFLRDSRAIPVAATDDTITVGMSDPLDRYVLDAMRLATGRRVVAEVATAAEVDEALRRHYPQGDGSDALARVEGGIDVTEADLARLKESASEAPVIRFVGNLISRAVEAGASDIHIEPLERRLRIRTRIDGVLKDEEPAPIEIAPAVISRIKIMSGLNIAERRLPQDGAVKLVVRGKEIDLRIATAPVAFGESAAVRILDKSSVALDFAALGFGGHSFDLLLNLLDLPNGIILVTGPTGSGKTTTLYAALQRLNTASRKILSVEEPVEYKISGINQIQVKPEIGLTFAHVLRSVLRHDPDVIMVGEIRDPETASIAIQASLTGHLVLSTVHTNSAAAAITRLLDMGVENYLLTSTIAGVLAQRLIRVLCRFCREPQEASDMLLRVAEEIAISPEQMQPHAARGCSHCNGTGYRGRSVIAELLVPSTKLRRLMMTQPEAGEVQLAAVAEGMETLRRNGLRRVLEGVTSLEEVLRVTHEEDSL
jgi:general secretion pathway protein E